jgi:hypothetical protein
MTLIIRSILVLLAVGCQTVFAAGAPTPEVRLVAYLVASTRTADGLQETLRPLKDLRPGDTIEYQATYLNPTAQTARAVMLTVPVPTGGLQYIAQQKSPLATSASIDGRSFAALPLTRVETVAGKPVVKPVPLADYRSLRWNLGDVPAGASRVVKARMVLPPLSSATVVAVNTAASLLPARSSSVDLNAGK